MEAKVYRDHRGVGDVEPYVIVINNTDVYRYSLVDKTLHYTGKQEEQPFPVDLLTEPEYLPVGLVNALIYMASNEYFDN